MSKITMEDIARELEISRASVWKVMNNKEGVSPKLRERVLQKAREMGYSKMSLELINNIAGGKSISIIVSRTIPSGFWTDILHSIGKFFADKNVNMIYTYVPNTYEEDFALSPLFKGGNIDGILVLNVYEAKILEMIANVDLAKVFLDRPPNFKLDAYKGDLISLEGVNTVYLITESIVKRGAKKISFIGDINYSATNKDRYLGYRQAMREYKLAPYKSLTEPIDIFEYDKKINDFLERFKEVPDAFVCANDYVASFVVQYFNDNPNMLTKDIIISGYDGRSEYVNVAGNITSARVDTNYLGRRLASQLLYRMENKSGPYENIYIRPQIVYREGLIKKRDKNL